MSELCSEHYLQTLGIRRLSGRFFSKAEIDSARRVVVINQSLARSLFPTEDPIGRQIKFPAWEMNYSDWPRGAYFEIVGVVADVKNKSLREPAMAQIFLPYTITATSLADDRVIMVKTAGNPESMLPTIRRAIHQLDSSVAVADTGTLESALRESSYADPRFGLMVVSSFAALGLVLVAIGIFSVMAYTVSLRTHEIGIRMALGARQTEVLSMVLKKGLGLIAAGVALGVCTSFGLTRFLAN